MTKIQKINKLSNIESFIQIDYFKGNKYIDKAGEFLDSLYDTKEDAPIFQMTIQGAEFHFSNNRKIRVSGTKLWTSFPEVDSLDIHKQFTLKAFDSVVNLFEPKKYERIGWRNYFVSDADTSKLTFLDNKNWFNGKFLGLRIEKSVGSYVANINITKLLEKDKDLERILFDVDIFKQLNNQTTPEGIRRCLDEIRDVFNSEDILSVINSVLHE